MLDPRSWRGTAAAAMLTAALVAACGSGQAPASPGQPAGTTGPTVIGLPELSLVPALVTSDPGVPEPPAETPPVGPPVGVPPPPPEVTADYTGPADDLAAFIAAYREAFGVPELPDDAIAVAGARLCTYLQRHATTNGSVDLGRAVTEAEINEPGYPREVWLQAFELATASYCGEFSFAPGTEG